MGIYLLWMVTCYFRPRERLTNLRRDFQVLTQGNQLPFPSASLPRGPTTEVQNVRGQRHGRVVLCLVRELVLAALAQGNPSESAFNFNCHDFLVVWNK